MKEEMQCPTRWYKHHLPWKGAQASFLIFLVLMLFSWSTTLGLVFSNQTSLTTGVTVGWVLSLLAAGIAFTAHPLKWFVEYWDRNVRGYTAYVQWNRVGGGSLVVHIWERGKPELWDRTTLQIPLGGWFNRPKVWLPPPCLREERWKIKQIHGLHECDPLKVKVTLTIPSLTTKGVVDQISLNLPDALRLLGELGDFGLSALWDKYSHLQGKLADLSDREHNLRAVISSAIRKIDEAHRFVRSKQGLEVRRYLDERLLRLDPTYTERRTDPPPMRSTSRRRERLARQRQKKS